MSERRLDLRSPCLDHNMVQVMYRREFLSKYKGGVNMKVNEVDFTLKVTSALNRKTRDRQ